MDMFVENVRKHGAIGNGLKNDTVAIRNAIDAAQAAGGKTIFFPNGTYEYSSLIVGHYPSVRFLGESRANTILHHFGFGIGIEWQSNRGEISNLEFQGNSNTTQIMNVGCLNGEHSYGQRTHIHDCNFSGGQNGLIVDFGISTGIDNCYFTGANPGYGLSYDNDSNISYLVNCQVRLNENGVLISGHTRGAVFDALLIESNNARGLYIDDASDIIIHTAWFENNGGPPIELTSKSTRCVVDTLIGVLAENIIDNGINNDVHALELVI